MSKAKSTRQQRKQRQHSRKQVDASFRSVTRDLTLRVFSVRAETADDDTRSLEAVFATENPVQVLDFRTWDVIDEVLLIDGMNFRDNVPLLDSHNRNSVDDVLGNARDIKIENGPGGVKRAVGRAFFDQDEKAVRAFQKFKSGSLRDFSIGYTVDNSVMIPSGEKAEISGRTFVASPQRDLRVTTESTVFEVSATPIGADPDAKARGNTQFEERKMDKFEKWLEARGLADASEETKAAMRPVFEEETARAKTPAPVVVDPAPAPEPAATDNVIPFDDKQRKDAEKRGADSENERIKAIRAEAGDSVASETVERCIAERMTLDATRAVFLKEIRELRSSPVGMPAVHVKDNTATERALTNGMFVRAGGVIKDEQEAEEANRFRSMSLRSLAHEACILDGMPASRHLGPNELAIRAFSSGSFGNITSNVAHKSLMKGYQNAISTAMAIFNIGNVSDFKAHKRIRLSDAPALDVVGGKGEVTHSELEDTAEDVKADTYAKLFTLSRQDIINDDIGALTKIPERMGGAARRTIDDVAWTEFMSDPNLADGISVFDATGHGNNQTGSGSAMTPANGIAALTAAQVDFLNQKDKNGTTLNIQPRFLVVPPTLKFNALQVIQSGDLRTLSTGSTDATLTNTVTANPHQGSLEVITEPRLENSAFTGNSTAAWYLLGDPALTDTLEIAFLNGMREPTLSRHETQPNILGITWRVIHDFGVKWLDFRSAHKNDGA